jgi:uncharacterized protein (TIGR03000 family)
MPSSDRNGHKGKQGGGGKGKSGPSLEERFDKFEKALDKISERLSKVEKSLQKQKPADDEDMPPKKKKKPQPKDDDDARHQHNRAVIVVTLPEGARLFLEDQETRQQTSRRRTFLTPELTPGVTYYYEFTIRADNAASETRRVAFRAGTEARLSFIEPAERAQVAQK